MYSYDDIRQRMEFAIPPWWQEIREVKAIQDITAQELSLIWYEYYTFVDGRYAHLGTTELWKWEVLLGMPVGVAGAITWDLNDLRLIQDMEGETWDSLEFDYTERRSAILARLRGFGTVTKQKLIEMAASYTGGTVTVTEYPGEYRVVIEFTDVIGVPEGLSELQKILREALPAHIDVEFKLKYITHNQFDAKGYSWDSLDSEDMTWDEFDSQQP